MHGAVRIVVAALVLGLSACAPQAVRLYDGPERPAAELAVVTLPEALEVEQINGTQVRGASGALRKGDVDLQLAPGRYELLVYYKEIWTLGDSDDALSSDPARFVFDAKAGHHYRIEYAHPSDYSAAKALAGDFSGWVEDRKTGEKIASQASGLQFDRSLTAQLSGEHELVKVAEKPDGRQVVSPLPAAADAAARAGQGGASTPSTWMPVMQGLWARATPEERRAFLIWIGQQQVNPAGTP